MGKGIVLTLLVLLLCTGSLFANRHHSDERGVHHCYGVGLHGGPYRGGPHMRVWFDDVVAINLKAFADYALTGGGGIGELYFKPYFSRKIRPYVTVGGGVHFYNLDTTLGIESVKERIDIGLFRTAVGAELRVGKRQKNSITLEVGFLKGESDYEYISEISGTDTTRAKYTTTIEPFSASLSFTHYFCKPLNKDRDGDGLWDHEEKCPQEPEDKDGFEDKDGCPDPDNDNDGIEDLRDNCPMDAEDRDGFEDEDGCPESDNDEDGLSDESDQCPNEAEDRDGFEDEDGCPDSDDDDDGIPDSEDKCKRQPEDKDGFADEDGCPDPDNDGDGIPDTEDQCPLEAEVFNQELDEDGCPDTLTLEEEIKRGPIVLKGVTFELGKSVLRDESYTILDEVVASLKEWPEISIEIQGHSDNVGSDALNLRISRDRARTVRNYFISKGIAKKRLRSKGFGKTRPVADNSTEEGRSQNRRVELHKLD